MEFLVTSDIFPELRHQHIKISLDRSSGETWKVTQKKDKSWSQMRLLGGTSHIIYVCKCSDLFSLLLGHARQGLVQASGEHHVVSLEDVTVAEQMADTSPVAWSMMLPKPSPVYRWDIETPSWWQHMLCIPSSVFSPRKQTSSVCMSMSVLALHRVPHCNWQLTTDQLLLCCLPVRWWSAEISLSCQLGHSFYSSSLFFEVFDINIPMII